MSCIKPQEFKSFEDVTVEYLVNKEGISTERAEGIAYDQWKQIFFENSTKTEAKVFSQLASNNGWIDIHFNDSYDSTKMKVVSVADDGKYYTIGMQNPSNGNVYEYTFLRGQSRSIDVPGKKQYVRLKQLGYTLGNSEDANIKPELYDKQELDLTNNIENSLVMLDKLSEIDGENTSTEHKSRLKSVLESFVNNSKQYIPKMNVYLYNEAEKAGGVLSIGSQVVEDGVYLNVSSTGKKVDTDASNAEVYAEEITHAATVLALKVGGVEAQTAKTKIQKLRDQVREEFNKEYDGQPWKAFLPEESIDAVYEEKQAKDMWDYIFENESTGIEEFIAKGLTWEVFANKLDNIQVRKEVDPSENTILGILRGWFDKLLQLASMKIEKEGFDTTATDVLVRMSAQLADANNRGIKQTNVEGFLEETFNKVNDLDQKMGTWVKKHIAKNQSRWNLPKQPKADAGKLAWAVYTAKLMPFLFGNPEGQIALKELMHAVGMKYGGDLQTLFDGSIDPDNTSRIAQRLRRFSENMDSKRESTAALVATGVADAFKKISKKEKEAITLAGLDVDIQSIYDDFNVVELLQDENKLQKAISDLRKEVRAKADTEKTGNYYVAQALGLGYYMANHQANNGEQLLNATLIARGHNRIESRRTPEVGEDVIKLIDQLATLEGMRRTPPEAKASLAELITREPDGMSTTVLQSRGLIAEARSKIFDDELGMIKGYTKEVFDEDVSLLIRPVKDRTKMKADGYKLIEILEKHPGDTSSSKMAIYSNKWHAQQNLKKGALRFTDFKTKGTTLFDVHNADNEFLASERAKANLERLHIAGIKEVVAMENGKYDFTEEKPVSLLPVYGRKGEAVQYRYTMHKRGKREHLRQDISAPKVLGRTAASIVDKKNTADHNDEVFDAIYNDMVENYNENTGKGKDPLKKHRYFRLEPDSNDPQIEEIWKLLPREFKEKMIEKDLAYLPVRADLFKAYFGMREWGLMDVIGNIPLVGDLAVELTPSSVKYGIQVAEHIWGNVVNLAKVNILIKIPEVAIRNVFSNVMIGPLKGHFNVAKVAKLQLKGAKALDDYVNKTHELIRLQNAKLAGNPGNLDLGRITSLKEDLAKHQVADLINEGMYQAIVEDIGHDELKSSNRIARFFDDQLDKAPGFVKDGAHILFLTEKTKYFKMMNKTIQYSDFASRYAIYELEKEKYIKQLNKKFDGKRVIKIGDIPTFETDEDANKLVGKLRATEMLLQQLRNDVLDVHVDYGTLDGPVLDWMNRIGFAMFSKYALRIVRPVLQMGTKHPLHLFSTTAIESLVGDLDTVLDPIGGQLNKFGNFDPFIGLLDDLPIYQAMQNTMNLTK
jgi:hypothetical protein